MSFKIGQKVVCVNDVFNTTIEGFYEVFHNLPKKNKTYIIRESESGRVLLEEVINPESPFDIGGMMVWDEPGFDENRFRDLQEALNALMNEDEESAPEKYVETIEHEEELLEIV